MYSSARGRRSGSILPLMTIVTSLSPFLDENANEIVCGTNVEDNIKIVFHGGGNKVVVKPGAKIGFLSIQFDCDGGYVEIGSHRGVNPFRGFIRVGERCRVVLGDN